MSVRADITITTGGSAIGTLRSAELTPTLELVSALPEEEYGWEEYLPSLRSWSAQGATFVPFRGQDAALQALKQAMVERSTISVIVDFGGEIETGTAVVEGINMQANVAGALQGSLSLTGTGILTAS